MIRRQQIARNKKLLYTEDLYEGTSNFNPVPPRKSISYYMYYYKTQILVSSSMSLSSPQTKSQISITLDIPYGLPFVLSLFLSLLLDAGNPLYLNGVEDDAKRILVDRQFSLVRFYRYFVAVFSFPLFSPNGIQDFPPFTPSSLYISLLHYIKFLKILSATNNNNIYFYTKFYENYFIYNETISHFYKLPCT